MTPCSWAKRAEEFAHFDHPGRIQAIGGFVQQDQFWLMQERARKAQALQIAQGQCAGAAVGVRRQVKAVDGARRDARVPHALQPPRDLQVFAHGQLRISRRRLHQMTDTLPRTTPARPDRQAKERHAARARPDHAQQGADGGGFARAVEAEKGIDLAAFDAQVDPIHSMDCAVLLR